MFETKFCPCPPMVRGRRHHPTPAKPHTAMPSMLFASAHRPEPPSSDLTGVRGKKKHRKRDFHGLSASAGQLGCRVPGDPPAHPAQVLHIGCTYAAKRDAGAHVRSYEHPLHPLCTRWARGGYRPAPPLSPARVALSRQSPASLPW